MKRIFIFIGLGFFLLFGCIAATKKNNSEAVSETVSSEGNTHQLTKKEFIKTVWNYNESPDEWKFLGDKPALIDFYADWCGPCRIAAPILEEVAAEYSEKIDVYKIDTQHERELAKVFGIKSIPAFLYIPMEGKPVMIAGIGRTNEETKEMFVSNIKEHLLK